jgi:hypothetical protein
MIEAYIIERIRDRKRFNREQPRLRSGEEYHHRPAKKEEPQAKRGVEIIDFSI